MDPQLIITGLASVVTALGGGAIKFLIDLWREEREERKASDFEGIALIFAGTFLAYLLNPPPPDRPSLIGEQITDIIRALLFVGGPLVAYGVARREVVETKREWHGGAT